MTPSPAVDARFAWWQYGVVYQIYPRSFQDSNGDGIGDLAGVASRLDYLRWLGVDAIWLSPVYPSPMADFGYDVSDYTSIDPVFGSLKDFDDLLTETHRRGMKLIKDFVPNHTSDQHPWFLESRASRDNPKRDWYIWREPNADGEWGEGRIDDDIYFWKKARREGLRIAACPKVRIGHLQLVITWPDDALRTKHQYVGKYYDDGRPAECMTY